MGALPNTQPRTETTRKPAGKARKAKIPEPCATRTLPQIQAEFRQRTNYDKGTGYFPVFHAFYEDLVRLSCGLSCDRLVCFTIQNLSIRSAGTHAMPEDAEMSVPELAMRIGCDERQVNRVLEYLSARNMAEISRLEGARFVIRLDFKQWAKIEESYAQWDAKRKAAEEAENPAEDAAEDEQDMSVKPGIVTLTKAPVKVRAGERCRPIKVNTGVRSLRIHWESKVLDLTFRAVVDSGELVLTGSVPEKQALKSNASAKREESTRSKHSSGHGRPNGRKIPPSEGKRNPPQTGEINTTSVEHPRAKELTDLFDPLVFGHCRMTLSGDSKYLAQACEAIGNTPHEDLVKAAVDRAVRALKPAHIPALCRQIQHDWEKGKGMPAAQRGLSREEMDAMVARDRAARIAKQKEISAKRRSS